MFGRAGLLVVITVALVMVGHAGPNDQAYFAAGFAPHMLVLIFGMGVVASVTVLSAQADGAGRPQQCGRIWRLGLLLAALCGAGAAVAMLWGREILRLSGQSDDIALHGGEVIWMFAPGMPAILMFIATSSFLESIGRPRPGMIVSLAANLVNLLLCWAFVFGKFGLPAMGAPGAALAISVTRWCMLAAIVGYALLLPEREHFGVRAPLAGHYHNMGKLLRVGTPLALAMGIESVAFTATTMFAGWLGNDALAAYQDAINVNAFVFMLALGIADGDLRARGQRRRPQRSGRPARRRLGRGRAQYRAAGGGRRRHLVQPRRHRGRLHEQPGGARAAGGRARPRRRHQHLRRAAGRADRRHARGRRHGGADGAAGHRVLGHHGAAQLLLEHAPPDSASTACSWASASACWRPARSSPSASRC